MTKINWYLTIIIKLKITKVTVFSLHLCVFFLAVLRRYRMLALEVLNRMLIKLQHSALVELLTT